MSAKGPRHAARLAGLTRYYTGRPCAKGHVADRYTKSGSCAACKSDDLRRGRMDNPERFRELDSRWRKENKDRVSAHQRAYRKRRPEKLLAKNSARRARTVEAMPSDFSDFDAFVIEEAARACRRRAKLHGEPFHIDHMIPLAAGGEHRATNIQVIPARLNLWKGDRLVLTQPGEWIAHA